MNFTHFYAFLRIFTHFSVCSDGGDGGRLVQFESVDELNLISDFLMFSTQSLPQKNGWLIGGFTDPFNVYSTLTDFEKM
jgi:hypothetical protein